MSIEITLPYSWLKTLSPDIRMVDESPLFGSPPAFPWKDYSYLMGQVLDLPNLKLEPLNVEWKLPESFKDELGHDPIFHPFSVSPLEGLLYLLIPKADLKNLFEVTIIKNSVKSTEPMHAEEWLQDWEKEWQEEFYQYLSLQAIQAFQKVNFDSSFSPQILYEGGLPTAPCLSIDLNLFTPNKTVRVRLLINQEMRQSLKQKYTPTSLAFPPNLSQALTAIIHVSIGHTTLSKNEWRSAKPGDFLLLDSCTLLPGDEKGRVVLRVNNTPIFRAKIKDGSLKLLEYPLLQEVQTPMAKEHDEEFDEAFDTEDDSSSNGNHEIDPFENEEETESTALSLSDDNLDAESEEKASSLSKDLLEKTNKHTSLVKLETIPLTLSVEIARLQISVEQLSRLAPGNLLDLNVTPENGVDLVVNGYCVGKGELLKLGETLGVRILDKT